MGGFVCGVGVCFFFLLVTIEESRGSGDLEHPLVPTGWGGGCWD